MTVHRLLPVVACSACLLVLKSAPGQAQTQRPLLEIGGTFGGAVTAGSTPSTFLLFGPRVTAQTSPSWAAQFDMQMIATNPSQGLYGAGVRFTPAPRDSGWYAFGGMVGHFRLPRESTFRTPYGIGHSEQVGAITAPNGARFGVGRRVLSGGRWGLLVEGQGVCTMYGMFISGGLEIAFAARRLPPVSGRR